MVPHIATELLRSVVDWAILAILFGAVATWIWASRRLLRGEALLPEAPIIDRRASPWGLGTIVLISVAYYCGSYLTLETYVWATRTGRADQAAATPAKADHPEADQPAGKEAAEKADGPVPREHRPDTAPEADDAAKSPFHGLSPLELMAIQGAINGVFLFALPWLARLTSGTRPRDLGIGLPRWRRQVAVGIVAVLFLMPIVYTIQAVCVSFLHLSEPEREKFKHPLEKMLRDEFTPGVASVALLTAVVLAPAFEELLFRGFLQGWLIRAFDRLAAWTRKPPSQGPMAPASDGETPPDATPAPNPLADPDLDRLPVSLDATILSWEAADSSADRIESINPGLRELVGDVKAGPSGLRPHAGAAIVLTSFLFAILHAAQWPAPIALFVLALGLGIVYERTGSLLAAICMHAVFNGFSTLLLFHVALMGQAPEKPPARPVLERVAPPEKIRAAAPAPVPDVGAGAQRGKT